MDEKCEKDFLIVNLCIVNGTTIAKLSIHNFSHNFSRSLKLDDCVYNIQYLYVTFTCNWIQVRKHTLFIVDLMWFSGKITNVANVILQVLPDAAYLCMIFCSLGLHAQSSALLQGKAARYMCALQLCVCDNYNQTSTFW